MTNILAYHKNHQKRCQNHQHILILNILFALQTFEHAQIAQASQAKRKQISGNHKNLAEYGGVNVNENVSYYLIIRSIDKTGDEDENIRSF